MRLGYHSITWGGVVGEPTGVTSIKNLHYRSNGSIVQAVQDIAAAGYEGIEIFDGNLADYAARPDDLRRLLCKPRVDLGSRVRQFREFERAVATFERDARRGSDDHESLRDHRSAPTQPSHPITRQHCERETDQHCEARGDAKRSQRTECAIQSRKAEAVETECKIR